MGKQNIIQYMHNIYVLQKKLLNQQVELLMYEWTYVVRFFIISFIFTGIVFIYSDCDIWTVTFKLILPFSSVLLIINFLLLICIVLYFESDVRGVYLSSG